jgi:phosphonopyruvate decarboxylase
MIETKTFFDGLSELGVRSFSGVPDSLLKDFCACVTDSAGEGDHLITANEGGAIAYAAGRYLASGQPGLVYLQNSGLGNTVNPLTSLADPAVYSLPMMLLVGWRGQPGHKDEPQHAKQGQITIPMLEVLGLPYKVLQTETDRALADAREMFELSVREHRPVALVVGEGSFSPWKLQSRAPDTGIMLREEVLEAILQVLCAEEIVVATTGKTSREVFEIRGRGRQGHQRDFLTVGSMGHASQIALGLAEERPNRRVICIDGDGAVLMHMGGMAIIGSRAPRNFLHVVINNGAHESVGGQPTSALAADLCTIARGCGYPAVRCVVEPAELPAAIKWLQEASGPVFLEIRTRLGSRPDLGRPTISPKDNVRDFIRHIEG